MSISRAFYYTTLGIILAGASYIGLGHICQEPAELDFLASVARGDGALPLSMNIEAGEELSGGDLSVQETKFRAFGRSAPNMAPFEDKWPYFRQGKILFDRDWTAVRSSPLGPHFSSHSCEGCHVKDGRGRPPAEGEIPESMVVQLTSLEEEGEPRPHPEYGYQLDYHALNEGEQGEGRFVISHEELKGSFADGEPFTLLKPRYVFEDLAYGSFGSDTRFSVRAAPAVFGLGLIEAIPAESILALADPDDQDRDGISGRPNYVYDVATGKNELGRFGWKANQPSLAQQIARAFRDDMGITTSYYPDTSTALIRRAGISAREIELDARDFDRVLFYTKLLAVPKRRDWEHPQVLRGKTIFHAAGCAKCHHPIFTTGVMPSYPELSGQVIRPYTDLLLHDMGEGLADDRPDGVANGREWRTPPLWGIGLIKFVNKHTRFLHDGRARNIEEAILWHGGEAVESQKTYRRLIKDDRLALLKFLESL